MIELTIKDGFDFIFLSAILGDGGLGRGRGVAFEDGVRNERAEFTNVEDRVYSSEVCGKLQVISVLGDDFVNQEWAKPFIIKLFGQVSSGDIGSIKPYFVTKFVGGGITVVCVIESSHVISCSA